ncbi:unnamed protein product [Enterobius vermicularis]|uniref:Uncharacterized protein n=1 Tax=Enterobius vermicularis TaxID=51028 RepID=A0A0N4V564_ENTVE|nr:unnamed protein product [Enterobius vermicularis]
MHDFGVRVITIEPGIFVTEINGTPKLLKSMNNLWEKAPDDLRKEYGEKWFAKDQLSRSVVVVRDVLVQITEFGALNLAEVTDAYFHAVTAKYPYLNYTVGVDARYV